MNTTEIEELAHQFYDEALTSTRKYTGLTFNLQLINKVYKEVCRRAKCYSDSDVITTVANTREYTKPTGYVAMRRVEYEDTNGYNSKLAIIRSNQINDTGGYPVSYYLDGLAQGKMGLDPIPDAVYTINRYFFKTPTANLTEGQSPDLVDADWQYIIAWGLAAEWAQIDTSDVTGKAERIPVVFERELQRFINYIEEAQNQDEFIPIS
jgi:hypothetical protein